MTRHIYQNTAAISSVASSASSLTDVSDDAKFGHNAAEELRTCDGVTEAVSKSNEVFLVVSFTVSQRVFISRKASVKLEEKFD